LITTAIHSVFASKFLPECTNYQNVCTFCQRCVADIFVLISSVDPNVYTREQIEKFQTRLLLTERLTTTKGDTIQ
jgi:hypothetical protein